MPGEFSAACGHLVAIAQYDRELIGEILFLDSRLTRIPRRPEEK
jgi:hypothetical protein